MCGHTFIATVLLVPVFALHSHVCAAGTYADVWTGGGRGGAQAGGHIHHHLHLNHKQNQKDVFIYWWLILINHGWGSEESFKTWRQCGEKIHLLKSGFLCLATCPQTKISFRLKTAFNILSNFVHFYLNQCFSGPDVCSHNWGALMSISNKTRIRTLSVFLQFWQSLDKSLNPQKGS